MSLPKVVVTYNIGEEALAILEKHPMEVSVVEDRLFPVTLT
jgi:predicted Fe-Mo cluster-binding NifX family protein